MIELLRLLANKLIFVIDPHGYSLVSSTGTAQGNAAIELSRGSLTWRLVRDRGEVFFLDLHLDDDPNTPRTRPASSSDGSRGQEMTGPPGSAPQMVHFSTFSTCLLRNSWGLVYGGVTVSEPSIRVRCPACKGSFDIPFVLAGVFTVCPSCGETVRPLVPIGTEYPATEFETAYRDFRELLRVPAYKPEVGRLLAQWFGIEIAGEGDSAVVRSRHGEPVGLLALHQRIQKDPKKRKELYRVAIGLGR